MPHKHTRRDQDQSKYDLPPDRIARPLPTRTTAASTAKPQTSTTKPKKAAAATESRGAKRRREQNAGSISAATKANHDTPRAFRRLMSLAGGKRVRAGLDSGVVETKKQKKERLAKERAAKAAGDAEPRDADEEEEETAAPTAPAPAPAPKNETPALTIRPGERLSEFNARVDAALPLAGLTKTAAAGGGGGKDPLGLAKTYRTRQERKLHKLYDQWRKEDAKIKEREAEARELAEERDAALDETLGVKWRLDFQQGPGGAGRKAAKRSKGGAANHYAGDGGGAGNDDMWADFNRKKGAATMSTVRAGVHGTAGAPPELTKIDTSKFNFARMKKLSGSGSGGGGSTADVEAAIAELTGKTKTRPAKGVNKRLVGGRVSKPGRGAGPNRTRA